MLASLWHAMDGCDGEKRRGHLSRSVTWLAPGTRHLHLKPGATQCRAADASSQGWGLGLAAVAIGRQAAGEDGVRTCENTWFQLV